MMEKLKGGTPWWVKGDLNGFFGLFSNVLTNFLAAIGLLIVIGRFRWYHSSTSSKNVIS